MTTPKRLDRKSFLTSSVAALSVVTLGACTDEGDGGGTGTGGAATGGTGLGGANTGGTPMGGAPTGGVAGTSGAGAGGSATGGSASGGAGGLATGGSATAGAGGSSGAGGGGGGTAGDGGGGGGTYTCTAETNNGDHSHPLTIPSSHVERGYGEKGVPYVLEDGGTGHTHTVELSPYEYIYLAGGTPIEEESSSTNGHTHNCRVACVR